jgi:SAM-dependent methyltransferase
MSATTETAPAAQEFADRIFAGAIGAFETLSIHIGDRLGLYGALAEAGPLTAAELAARTGIDERYAREWLEQQAVAGILGVTDETEARFAMPAAHVAALCNPDSLLYSAPIARMLAAAAAHMPDLLAAYRTGGGVAWAALGDDARNAQGDLNRPWFEHRLATVLAEVPAVHDRLAREGALVADVGCGHGWSTIALARAYPQATVEGFDIDGPSIDAARRHGEGVPNVRFSETDGADAASSGPFDVAFVFEALHDMPHPIAVLAAIRASLAPDGVVVIMDEAVADRFAPNGDEVERIMYGYSLFVCLPDSMSTPGSAATGTMLRPATLERYAHAAGYGAVEVLPIEGFAAFRFTMLRP